MGIFLSRSSSSRSERRKTKWGKGKRKQFEKMETSNEGDDFIIQNNNEHKNSNENLNNSYEEWNKRIDQQEISNINDPPGAPSTFQTNYPIVQNDLINSSWSTHHDVNNQFYQINSHPMTTTSNIPYDPNQYVHTNTFHNQPQQVILEERTSKKVQFAHPIQQQASSSKNPLNTTQSWHEPSVTTNDISTSTTRQESLLNKQSAHRSVMQTSNTSSIQTSVEKPIYVGIDHKATLAERGQTTINKRHHRNDEQKNNSDGLNSPSNTHRKRPHTHHQHKHQESNDLLNSKVNIQSHKSLEPLQQGPHRSLITTSTSTTIPNKSIQHTEQPIFNDYEMKISKTRGIRQPQAQHIEQQSVVHNELKLSRNKGNHPQQHHQQQRLMSNRNNSPVRIEAVRRVGNKQPGSPIMRIPVSQQQRQKQSTTTTTTTTKTTLARTRI